MSKKSIFFIIFIILGLSCASVLLYQRARQQKETVIQNNTGMTNPASANCLDLGGDLEIRENDVGQYGVCIFENGRECEEWSLFRGDCDTNKPL